MQTRLTQIEMDYLLWWTAIICMAMAFFLGLLFFTEGAGGEKTGDVYTGTGDWAIENPTVYRNESEAFEGVSIIITPTGSLTFDNGTLWLNNSAQTVIMADGAVDLVNANITANVSGSVHAVLHEAEMFRVNITGSVDPFPSAIQFTDFANISESTIVNHTLLLIDVVNCDAVDFYNCPGAEATLNYGNDDCRIYWYATHQVLDSLFEPLPNTRVVVYNNQGERVFNGYSDSTGCTNSAWYLVENDSISLCPFYRVASYQGVLDTETITLEYAGTLIIVMPLTRTFTLHISYYNEFTGPGVPKETLKTYYQFGARPWVRFIDYVEIDFVDSTLVTVQVADYLDQVVTTETVIITRSVQYLDIPLLLVDIHLDNDLGIKNWTITRQDVDHSFYGSWITVLGGYEGSAPLYKIAWDEEKFTVEDDYGTVINGTVPSGKVSVRAVGEAGKAFVTPYLSFAMKPNYEDVKYSATETATHLYIEYGTLGAAIFTPILLYFGLKRILNEGEFKRDVNEKLEQITRKIYQKEDK